MPYLGNNHIAGDHTNNFKVLDDISSYTATFDGSATSVVDTTNNTIRVVEHRFIQGQRVTYTNGGGGNIGGLTTGTAYFVIFDSASTIKLATSASNAANSTAINLSAVGSGSSHTLNAAFDGVNKKFKLTHGSGTGARLNNATQINVAINNVVQRPNLDPNNFTDGFALEDNHKIVFQTVPTSEDIFWGSIIANTLTTFDISDHKIDTFTGDGSTTEFTLSHTPANNESLMVTINGVLQHPSNASTARAYTLIASIIQFTAAPGVGDEIQVRHLGFAGATTADVSGFYGRTGNVVLTSNDHITTGNINAGIVTATSFDGTFSSNIGGSNANFTGIVTAGTFKGGNIDAVDGAFSGNVTIGGTLTYEDVTNIDSVGIITARNGIDCNGDLDVDGHTNLDNVSIAGVTTSQTINFATNARAHFASNNRLSIHSNGTNSYLDYAGALAVRSSGGSLSAISLASNGNVNIVKDLDVDGHTNLDNVSVSGVTTTTGNIHLNSGAKVGFATDSNTFIGQDDYDRLDFNVGGKRLASIIEGTNIPVLVIDKDGINNARSNQNTNYNANPHATELVLGNTSSNNHGLTIVSPSTNYGVIMFSDGSGGGLDATRGSIVFTHSDNKLNLKSKIGSVALTHKDDEKLATTDAGISIPKNLDVDGHTNLDNVSVAGVSTAIRYDVNFVNAEIKLTTNQSSFSRYGRINHYHNNGTTEHNAIQFSPRNGATGRMMFYNMVSGSVTERLRIDGTDGIQPLAHIIPMTDSTYNLGSNGTRFANVYADTLYGNGANITNVDAATLDGVDGANYVRTNQNTTITSDLYIGGGAGGITVNGGSDIRFTNGDWTGNVNGTAKIQHHSNYLYIAGGTNGIIFRENNDNRWILDGSGHFVPGIDSTYDIGLTGTRVRNIYADSLYGTTLSVSGFVITSTGNVGINETTPEAKLELDGRFRILDNSDGTPTSGKGLEISYYTGADMADILSYDRGGGSYKKLQLRGSSVELKKNNTVLVNVGTGGNNASVGFSTTTNLVTNAEAIAVRGYSSFKSPSATYAAIYTNNELNGTGVLTPHILFNNNGANRGGFGYHTDNSSLIMANHNDIMFKTGATQLGGTERLRITSGGQVRIGNDDNLALWGQNNRLQVAGTDWNTSGVTIAKMGNSTATPNLIMGSSRGSTPGTAINNGDRLGYISFVGDDGTDMHTVGAAIVAGTDAAPSSNNIPGTLQFYTGSNTSTEKLRIGSDGTSTFDVGAPSSSNKVIGRFQAQSSRQLDIVWHDSGSLMGFNTPGNHSYIFKCNNTERLRIDSSGRIGINYSPSVSHEYLNVSPVGNNVLDIAYRLNSSTDIRHKHYSDDGTYRGGFNYTRYSNSTRYPNLHHDHYWVTNPSGTSTQVSMRLTREGYLLQQYIPAFGVAKSDDGGQISSGVYVFNQVHFNNGSHYSTSNGRFTAPKAGAYFFSFSLQLYGGNAAHCRFQINGSDVFSGGTSSPVYEDGPDSHETISHSMVLNLAQGDYVTVTRNNNTRGMQSSFCGYMLG